MLAPGLIDAVPSLAGAATPGRTMRRLEAAASLPHRLCDADGALRSLVAVPLGGLLAAPPGDEGLRAALSRIGGDDDDGAHASDEPRPRRRCAATARLRAAASASAPPSGMRRPATTRAAAVASRPPAAGRAADAPPPRAIGSERGVDGPHAVPAAGPAAGPRREWRVVHLERYAAALPGGAEAAARLVPVAGSAAIAAATDDTVPAPLRAGPSRPQVTALAPRAAEPTASSPAARRGRRREDRGGAVRPAPQTAAAVSLDPARVAAPDVAAITRDGARPRDPASVGGLADLARWWEASHDDAAATPAPARAAEPDARASEPTDPHALAEEIGRLFVSEARRYGIEVDAP